MIRLAALLIGLVAFVLGAGAPARAQTGDSNSPLLKLLLMGAGLHANDWGIQTNGNLTKVENAIAGVTSLSVIGGSMTLTDDQARSAVLSFSGTLAANEIVTVPSRSKLWVVVNATSGAYTLSIKTSSGTPVVVPQSATLVHLYYCDGAAIYDVSSDGLPALTSNTVLANTGSGTAAIAFTDFVVALGLDVGATPSFSGVDIAGAAASQRLIRFRTTTAAGPPPVYATRWTAGADDTAEGGSNAGSDFKLCALADNGTSSLGCPLVVTRSTGAAALSGAATIAGPLTVTSGPLTVGGVAMSTPAEGFNRNLQITVTSDTALTVTADSLTMVDASNNVKAFRGLNATGVSISCTGAVRCLDTGSPGTSRWLNVWAVGKADGTISAMLTASAASTPPSPLPTDYVYYQRLGAVRIDASARVVRTKQVGQSAYYVVQGSGSTPNMPRMGLGGSGGAGTAGNRVAISVSAYAPPTATKIYGTILNVTGTEISAAPNNNYDACTSTTNPPPVCVNSGAVYASVPFEFMLETTSIYWFGTSSNDAIFARGWNDGV